MNNQISSPPKLPFFYRHFPVILGAIIVIIIAGGVFAWQYWLVPKERAGTPEAETSVELEYGATPNIVVTSPVPNQTITNPVRVAGESDTFEANVRIIIKDDNDKVLANTFTMGGAYGVLRPFSKDVFFAEPSAQTGVITVFEESPKDGTIINKVTVPIKFGYYEERVIDIKVISPNRGERWERGTIREVKWKAVGAERITAYKILPPEEATGKNYCYESVNLISHMPADWDGGKMGVTVASNACLSDRYKVKVCDLDLWAVGIEACDESDNYFSIVE